MNIRLLGALISLSGGAALAATFPADWKNFQTIEVQKTDLVKFSVPLPTLDAARPGLEDLRLFDDDGRELPCLIERPVQQRPTVTPGRSFKSSVLAQSTIGTFETQVTVPIKAVNLITPSQDFLKAVKLEALVEGTGWKTILENEPVFRDRWGARRLLLEFPPAVYSQLRVTFDDRDTSVKRVAFTGVEVYAAIAETAPSEPLEMTIADRRESQGKTQLTLRTAAANFVLAELEVQTPDPLFRRMIRLTHRAISDGKTNEIDLRYDTIYRVAVAGQPVQTRLAITPDVQVPAREIYLSIENGDSPPLQITGVTARRRPAYLAFFTTKPGKFHLLSGNPAAPAPHYDLAALPGAVKAELTELASVSPLLPNPAYRAPEALPAVTGNGSDIDLARWSFRKRIEITNGAVQQVELDLDVLSHAARGFEDLRVIRDGQQIPYVLDRSTTPRSVAPDVAKTPDPKRPHWSRWTLKLPRAALPLTQLECTTRVNLFKRPMELLEQVPDDRGNLFTAVLGRTEWIRVSPEETGRLSLTLTRHPRSDRVILETDNGDNPAIEFEDFQFWYPAVHVLFKAAAGPPTFLYYGNEQAGAPRYDIGLVTRQVLTAEKTQAGLGKEEILRRTSVMAGAGDGAGSWIFWIVLGGVVLVLLVVLAKLLPKSAVPPSAGGNS
ncbi:MAG TPA: hypothetical protein VI454_14005 [Verrucomicrobiae bacterium]